MKSNDVSSPLPLSFMLNSYSSNLSENISLRHEKEIKELKSKLEILEKKVNFFNL
jgi:hypothetical protein